MSAASSPNLPPGAVVPGWTRLITNLSPKRLEFDSLAYVIENTAKYGRIFSITLGDDVTVVISDPDLAHELLVTRAAEVHKAPLLKRSVGELLGNGLLLSEGDFWRRQRKLSQPAFHAKRIESYGDVMTAATHKRMADWRTGETRDVAHEMMAITLDVVCKTLFDIDVTDKAARVGELMHTVLAAASDRMNLYEPYWERLFKTRKRREDAAVVELNAIVDGIIRDHRNDDDRGDLLSMLLAARDDDGNPMSEKQLRDEVMTLFVAGHETTANLLAWTFHLLAQHPDVEARALAEVDALGADPRTTDLPRLTYLEQILKEVMRLYPPAGGATRTPLKPFAFGGYTIPPGVSIALSSYVMHRDPQLFPDPLRFDPERFSAENEPRIPKYAYLPFGAGPRVCIGNAFAMMEAQLILAGTLRRARLSATPGRAVKAEQLFTIRPRGGLPMTVTLRA
jgi:cytochrome P450